MFAPLLKANLDKEKKTVRDDMSSLWARKLTKADVDFVKSSISALLGTVAAMG